MSKRISTATKNRIKMNSGPASWQKNHGSVRLLKLSFSIHPTRMTELAISPILRFVSDESGGDPSNTFTNWAVKDYFAKSDQVLRLVDVKSPGSIAKPLFPHTDQ